MRGLAARYSSSQPSPHEHEAPLAAAVEAPAPLLLKQPVLDEFGRAYATGRRKTSVARVWIKEGSGQFVVNDKSFLDYFQPIQREHALGAFVASKTAGLFDTFCTVKGGGISGQAGAVRLGISRALEAFDPTHRILLRQFDMLTRDSRRVERKKPGQKKARKKFQVRALLGGWGGTPPLFSFRAPSFVSPLHSFLRFPRHSFSLSPLSFFLLQWVKR